MTVFIIDGIDRTGKDLLVQSIRHSLGYHEVIHFGKPEKLRIYEYFTNPLKTYQRDSFDNAMRLVKAAAKAEVRLILNRSWLGEYIYAPLYRGYQGDFVFDLEREHELGASANIRLILLLEDFQASRHFTSDGQSFDDTAREEEQDLFIEAFNRSIIADKRMIWVTDPDTGQFKSKERILEEALR